MNTIPVASNQKLYRLKRFFDHPGYKDFTEEINNLKKMADIKITNLQNKPVTNDSLSEMNFLLGQKRNADLILALKDKMLDDAENSSDSEDAKDGVME